MQFNALTKYGCTTIYQERISGKNTYRPELKKLLESLRKCDHVDSTTATGRFTFQIIRERTKARLFAARARGKKGGSPSGLSPEKLQLARTALYLHDTGKSFYIN